MGADPPTAVHSNPDSALLGLRVVLGALIAGQLLFGAVAFLTGPLGEGGSAVDAVLRWVLLANAAAAVALMQAAPRIFVRKVGAGWDPAASSELRQRRTVPVYLQVVLVTAAVAESLGLFGLIMVLLNGSPWGLAGAALSLVLLLNALPSRAKLDAWSARLGTGGPV